MANRKPTPQAQADRLLCPVHVSGALGLKVRDVAEAMRAHGVPGPLQTAQAKLWRHQPQTAPAWLTGLYTEQAVRAARRQAREERLDLEHEHRMLVLQDAVEQRLLAGKRLPRSDDARLIAEDLAFRASKELVRNCSPLCGGPVTDALHPVELAALRWAGIDPDDHDTWVIHRGDCPAVADEPAPRA